MEVNSGERLCPGGGFHACRSLAGAGSGHGNPINLPFWDPLSSQLPSRARGGSSNPASSICRPYTISSCYSRGEPLPALLSSLCDLRFRLALLTHAQESKQPLSYLMAPSKSSLHSPTESHLLPTTDLLLLLPLLSQ